ncbi:PQ-loop repeat-containing protein 1 isoform X2 [Scleropages formosus]|uniref:PQ-loop repeat-containing protein 1 isoform X2 n=1 Tax=Scleropages formosus TaxID=113540 RepID=UPI0010FABCDF|nr:PQ-loop repeat-containing protein 1-like isoform X2 [Scleropages formosus]
MDLDMGINEDMERSWSLLSWVASSVMVLGGVVPYVPQYLEIQHSSNTEGFSTRVCLVLLIANILRIFFWIGKQFELTLLLQSVVMILTMLVMLHLCCTVQSTIRVSTKQHRFTV